MIRRLAHLLTRLFSQGTFSHTSACVLCEPREPLGPLCWVLPSLDQRCDGRGAYKNQKGSAVSLLELFGATSPLIGGS